jgi:hypothetical protein
VLNCTLFSAWFAASASYDEDSSRGRTGPGIARVPEAAGAARILNATSNEKAGEQAGLYQRQPKSRKTTPCRSGRGFLK